MISETQIKMVSKVLGTTDKKVIIGHCIKTMSDNGATVKQSIDWVLGDGVFDKMVSDTYNKMQVN